MIKLLGVFLLFVLAARGQLTPTAQEYPMIPSNFDVNSGLVPSWGTGDIAPVLVGAFRFICNPGHVDYDDPIVYPGQPGKSHLHQWFGNTLANGHSTYESLRKSGNSTCGSPFNRSGYWMPAMLNGKGGVVRPDYVRIYYKRQPKTDPSCFTMGAGGCVKLPRGLRFIFGYDLITKTQKTGAAYFNCNGANSTSGHFEDIIEAGKHCTTMHADWFGAWDDGVMDIWTDNCIDKLFSCNGGDLGNGKQLKNTKDSPGKPTLAWCQCHLTQRHCLILKRLKIQAMPALYCCRSVGCCYL